MGCGTLNTRYCAPLNAGQDRTKEEDEQLKNLGLQVDYPLQPELCFEENVWHCIFIFLVSKKAGH